MKGMFNIGGANGKAKMSEQKFNIKNTIEMHTHNSVKYALDTHRARDEKYATDKTIGPTTDPQEGYCR